MPSVEYDLRYLKAALPDLEGYLLSKEIYWPISVKPPHGDPPYPRFTLAGLLLARQSLTGRALDADQMKKFQEVSGGIDDVKARWRTAWSGKAARNHSARLNQWNNFMDDYRKQPENNLDRYAYEVRGRVMLELLQPESVEIPAAEIEMVKGLDLILKNSFLDGHFVWDEGLIPCFPRSRFWYLYGSLSKTFVVR